MEKYNRKRKKCVFLAYMAEKIIYKEKKKTMIKNMCQNKEIFIKKLKKEYPKKINTRLKIINKEE